jgi:cytochrome P450
MQRDPLGFLSGIARQYGPVSHIKLLTRHVYIVNEPELIREILVTQAKAFTKNPVLQRTKVILGQGLLTSEGEFHLRQRRMAQPAFHRERIQGYAAVMIDRALKTREGLRDGTTIDLAHEMMTLTLAVVAKTLFDANVDDDADEIGGALTELMDMFPMLMSPWADILQKLPIPSVLRMRRAVKRLDRVIYGLIGERRRSGEDRGDLLSMLLLAQDEEGDGGQMTDLQVRDEAMTLFLAGHETTANALAWTWYLLSKNADVERKMHEEIDVVLRGRTPQPSDYPLLPYTEMVLAESMRLYPPAWAIGRMARHDVTIGPWTIPKGAVALPMQWITHHDARFWPDPERFDPTRFTADEKAKRPRFSYFPFGGGPRICIGESFAWMEGVLVLATIAQKFRFEIDGTVETQPVITLRPKGGMRARVVARS